MRRFPVPLFVIACVALLASAVPARAHAAAGGRSLYSRPVCPAAPIGKARCLAEVVTDATGAPAVSSTPPSTALMPRDFHLMYQIPCVPGGTVDGGANLSTAQYQCHPTSYGGQIIAIVDAYNDPTVASDLNTYDSTLGLASCPQGTLKSTSACLTVVNEQGGSKLPAVDPNNPTSDEETALDVETAHMIDQSAKILLVEAASNGFLDYSKAVQTAASLGATEISNSYGTNGEWSTETQYDPSYDHAGVAVVAASNDFGTNGENTSYPAASPYVVAVGGTTVTVNNGAYSETVWGHYRKDGVTWEGAGSGCSNFEGAPYWQSSLTPDWQFTGCQGWNGLQNARSVADVAAASDPVNGGGAIYYSPPNATAAKTAPAGWYQFGGTSQATPIIAGIYALAGGVPAGQLAGANLYQRYFNAVSSSPAGATYLTDITTGSNWNPNTVGSNGANITTCPPLTDSSGNPYPWVMCQGAVGYDGPTGLGTPIGVTAFTPPGP